MTGSNDPKVAGEREIVIVRAFNAPRDLVFGNWIEAEHLQAWFAPDGFTVTSCTVDPRPGGRWRVEYRSAAGSFVEHGEFREVAEPERLVFSLTQETDGQPPLETLVTVIFAKLGASTEMTFRQTGFDTTRRRDDNAEGWSECFGKLEAHLAAS